MANYNKVILVGHLTRDPEMKSLSSGTLRARMGLAVNRVRTDKDGKTSQEVNFFNLVAFGKRAETLLKFLHKGDPVLIEGHLNNWSMTADDGQTKKYCDVIVDGFQFLNRGNREGAAPRDAEEGSARGAADDFPGSRHEDDDEDEEEEAAA